MKAKELVEDFADVICKLVAQKSEIPAGVKAGRILAYRDKHNYVAIELPPGTEYRHTGKDFTHENSWVWVVNQMDYLDKPVMRVKPNEIIVPEPHDDGTKPDWEVMLNVMCPNIKRPRRTSLHTLAAVLGRKDPLELAKEMKKSKKVVGYVCPDVKTPIFYLKSLATHPGMIDTRRDDVWEQLPAFFEKHPFPEVKGFKRFAGSSWTGGSWGKGQQIQESSAMDHCYEPDDFPYAKLLIKTLKEAGFTPGITEQDLKR